ncbi:molybdopterin synthase catalytic subunit MoaE [Marinobacterium mangrovicola]|uniref:Molybdopterin synthase catalytic subunit n=1 Tax=Marinobacterium mangrovicola TaxID=1476959 RepID=A0A4R1GPW2_9GAMM|nr:molybdopterin synthase catalytic subunit MoaE [Marinobacterium mangrovicola]TCK09390.1 molybdopterin synthase subunit MoaE [Marinobacterium mangrovicola]
MQLNDIGVQQADFDLSAFNQMLRQGVTEYGAVVTFSGLVRDFADGSLQALELEHYPGMTERSLQRIVEQARERWSLGNIVVRHRVGRMEPGDEIVFVGVTSAHRREAFEAAQFLMDYLKRDAPFWKKEIAGGKGHWVDQKETDLRAADAWGSENDRSGS